MNLSSAHFYGIEGHVPLNPKVAVCSSKPNALCKQTKKHSTRRDVVLKDKKEYTEFEDFTELLESIKACGKQKNLSKATKIHVDIFNKGLLGKNIHIGTALLGMYAKCGMITKAQEVFDELPNRDVVSWNALITAYAEHGLAHEALRRFAQMQNEGLSPNPVTFLSVLNACGSMGTGHEGKKIHAEINRQGLLEKDISVGSALVDMYAKCGMFPKAQEVFDELPRRNVVAWTALIGGYVQHGLGYEAIKGFERMQDEGFHPDAVTFACVLKACGSIGAIEKGKEIHLDVRRQGLLGKDLVLGTALMGMYAKCRGLIEAQEVFDELSARSAVTWNLLLTTHTHQGLDDEAMKSYERMQEEGFSPDEHTFACILKACGRIGAVTKGKEIHAEAQRKGWLEKDPVLCTAVVDMYAKCGVLTQAQRVFNELPMYSTAYWNALIAGYAQCGEVRNVFFLFDKMIKELIEPDAILFLVLLTACSHAGLLEEGQVHFNYISTIYCISPTLQHYACIVDLFSRAGHIRNALHVIEQVPPSDCLSLWVALLGACRKWVDFELGKWTFEHVVHLDQTYTPAYVCMRNLNALN